MKKKVLSLSTFLILTIVSFLLLNIPSAIADECLIEYKEQTQCPECEFEKVRGVAYGTGDCRARCKEWGESVTSVNIPYQSYNYIAWDSGLRICNVSTAPVYDGICPIISIGTSECDYQ